MRLSKTLVIILTIFISLFIFVGCNSKNDVEDKLNNVISLLNDEKYDEFYEMLSSKSKDYIEEEFGGKEGFINKYDSIYSAIGISNINIKIKEYSNKSEIPMYMTIDTIGGKLEYEDFKVNLVKEGKDYKIVWDESLILPEMTQGDKVRVKITSGSRGRILDRNQNPLAYNGEVKLININKSLFENNKEENIKDLAKILDINEDYIQNKLDENEDELIFLVKLSNYEDEKLENVSKINGIVVQNSISRVYKSGEAFGSLLGYIGNITSEELENSQGKGYTSISQIGKNGLEQVYEDKLRAKDGVHIYIERNNEKITILKTHASDGEDIQISIDPLLQEEIYNQMNNNKGASIAMDSTSGEVLAMVSSPSYDSNSLVTYKTNEVIKKWEESENAEFDNRINNLYSPGSTMKLVTASIGLEKDVINPKESMVIKGLSWQNNSSWGNYKVSRVKDVDNVNLYKAVKYSDNIYFADKAIKIGSENLIKGAKKFSIGDDLNFEYPMPSSQISNSGELKDEVLLADSGYGQGEVLVTPLNVTMMYSSLANNGKIMMPRLVLNENNDPEIYSQAIEEKYLDELKKDFTAVINDKDGSGYKSKVNGLNLAGKTGTAEIKSSKDDDKGNENSWFVVVDLDKSKLAVSMVMEDMKYKSTSNYLVPKVKNVFESYVK